MSMPLMRLNLMKFKIRYTCNVGDLHFHFWCKHEQNGSFRKYYIGEKNSFLPTAPKMLLSKRITSHASEKHKSLVTIVFTVEIQKTLLQDIISYKTQCNETIPNIIIINSKPTDTIKMIFTFERFQLIRFQIFVLSQQHQLSYE